MRHGMMLTLAACAVIIAGAASAQESGKADTTPPAVTTGGKPASDLARWNCEFVNRRVSATLRVRSVYRNGALARESYTLLRLKGEPVLSAFVPPIAAG